VILEVSILAVLSLKKVLVVAFLGAILFVASFVVSEKMNANEVSCDASGGVWGPAVGDLRCGGAVGGQPMVASYYGPELAGNPTASGEPYNPERYTAAHRNMPFGTRLLVSREGDSVSVTVNDRGPHVDGRDLDLSEAAAETIGLPGPGVAPVEVDVL
jgi:Lytic transglycolase